MQVLDRRADLPGDLRWRTRLDIARFVTQQLGTNLPELGGALSADLHGDLENWAAKGTLDTELARLGPVSADFDLVNASGQ